MTDNPLKFTLYVDENTREATLFYRPDGELKRRVDFEWNKGSTVARVLGDRVATEPVNDPS